MVLRKLQNQNAYKINSVNAPAAKYEAKYENLSYVIIVIVTFRATHTSFFYLLCRHGISECIDSYYDTKSLIILKIDPEYNRSPDRASSFHAIQKPNT